MLQDTQIGEMLLSRNMQFISLRIKWVIVPQPQKQWKWKSDTQKQRQQLTPHSVLSGWPYPRWWTGRLGSRRVTRKGESGPQPARPPEHFPSNTTLRIVSSNLCHHMRGKISPTCPQMALPGSVRAPLTLPRESGAWALTSRTTLVRGMREITWSVLILTDEGWRKKDLVTLNNLFCFSSY